jgi:hypothetical protein
MQAFLRVNVPRSRWFPGAGVPEQSATCMRAPFAIFFTLGPVS